MRNITFLQSGPKRHGVTWQLKILPWSLVPLGNDTQGKGPPVHLFLTHRAYDVVKDTSLLKPACNPTGPKNTQDGRLRVFVSLLVETLFYSKLII